MEECVLGEVGKVELASGWKKLALKKETGIILPGRQKRPNLQRVLEHKQNPGTCQKDKNKDEK